VANLQQRAQRLAPQLSACAAIKSAEPVESQAYLGGGSVPSQGIASWAIALEPDRGSVDELAASLRSGTPAVFGRISKDRLLLDLRAVFPRDDMRLVEAVQQIQDRTSGEPELGDSDPNVS
jgi:L-seryl-tRNA(Ser) seleniumtransferase